MIAKPKSHACNAADKFASIASLNDDFRTTGAGGILLATAGIIALAPDALPAILTEVRAFAAFTEDNDPHGEHDFGALIWSGHKLFWKIDCYDKAMEFGSPDPTDPDVTTRVLTIMLASEY